MADCFPPITGSGDAYFATRLPVYVLGSRLRPDGHSATLMPIPTLRDAALERFRAELWERHYWTAESGKLSHPGVTWTQEWLRRFLTTGTLPTPVPPAPLRAGPLRRLGERLGLCRPSPRPAPPAAAPVLQTDPADEPLCAALFAFFPRLWPTYARELRIRRIREDVVDDLLMAIYHNLTPAGGSCYARLRPEAEALVAGEDPPRLFKISLLDRVATPDCDVETGLGAFAAWNPSTGDVLVTVAWSGFWSAPDPHLD